MISDEIGNKFSMRCTDYDSEIIKTVSLSLNNKHSNHVESN
jgi:hypothetical protein